MTHDPSDRDPLDAALDDLSRDLPDGDPGAQGPVVRREVLFAIGRSRRRRVLAFRLSTLGVAALAGVAAAMVLRDVTEEREAPVRIAAAPGLTRITQESGRVDYDVAPRRPGERFVVATPNAEVEVRGTRFTVDVQGPLTSVDVAHGRVEVREPGGPLRAVLHDGERTAVQRPTRVASAAADPPGLPPPPVPAAAVPAPPLADVARVAALPAPAPTTHVAAPAPPVRRQPDDAELRLFRVAHELHFRDGDLPAAARAWDRYLAAYPNGALTEDARYNRAVCLLRLGRGGEADQDLRALSSDPTAFRAREAKLLRAASLRREGRCAEAEVLLAPLRIGTDEIARRAGELEPCPPASADDPAP